MRYALIILLLTAACDVIETTSVPWSEYVDSVDNKSYDTLGNPLPPCSQSGDYCECMRERGVKVCPDTTAYTLARNPFH